MPDWIEVLSVVDCGVITSRMAQDAGVRPSEIRRAILAGQLVRVRRGAYVAAPLWNGSMPHNRHRLLVIATARLSPRPLVVSNLSAAAMHKLPTIGVWPTSVHTLEPGVAGGASASLLTSHAGPASEVVVIDGVTVTTVTRTLVDIAATQPFERSVVAMDTALRRLGVKGDASGGGVRKALLEELESISPRYGRRRAEEAIMFSDGRSESPGESLSRVRFKQLGFVVPTLQVRFLRANNGRDAVVDFFWKGARTAGEFDGKQKYTRGRFIPDDIELGEVVFQEKRREDALRRTCVDSVARWVWDEVRAADVFFRLMNEYEVPRVR